MTTTEQCIDDLVYRTKGAAASRQPNQFPVVLGTDRVLFVDIDRTLVQPMTYQPDVSDYSSCVYIGDILYERLNQNIQLVRRFAASDGIEVILWSAGGARWAGQVCRALGLQDCVVACISKPSWYLDDLADAGFAQHDDKYINARQDPAWTGSVSPSTVSR